MTCLTIRIPKQWPASKYASNMAAAITLTKFNDSKTARAPHKEMGPDGRYWFKGRPLVKHPGKRKKLKRQEPIIKSKTNSSRFKVGQAHLHKNRLGTHFTRQYKIQDLIEAIEEVEDDIAIDPKNMSDDCLLTHFVRRAFKSDAVLKDLMKKLLPDLKHVDADIDVTEQFQLIIDATGSDDEDDIVDVEIIPTQKALPAPKRKARKKRKRA